MRRDAVELLREGAHALLHALKLLPVTRPWVVLALIGLAGLLWALGFRLKHRRRRLPTLAALVFAILVAVAGGADAANIYFDYMPHAGDVFGVGSWHRIATDVVANAYHPGLNPAVDAPSPTTLRSGGVGSIPVDDNASHFGDYRANVYLPPQYFTQPDRRFGVLYLLHGSPGVPLDWLRGGQAAAAGLAAAQAGHPVIIVMPRDSHWWLDDSECVDSPHELSDSYVTHDVVPAVDARLRTVADRGHRAVGGMSAGGYCALNLGLRHRDLFSAIVDLSGLTEPTHAGGITALFGSGRVAERQAVANTPSLYAAQLPNQPHMALWMDAGTSDGFVLTEMRTMRSTLQAKGYSVRLGTRPGAHTFHVWAPALRESLPWVAQQFGD